jgi:terminase small subunit / prophage DNA-packing protein
MSRKTSPAKPRRKEAATLTAQRERLAALNADIATTKLAKLKGEVVPVADVVAEWSNILRTVRARMLAVPSRVSQRLPHLSAHDVSEVDYAIRQALTELGRDHT